MTFSKHWQPFRIVLETDKGWRDSAEPYREAGLRFADAWFRGVPPYYVRVGMSRRRDLLTVAWQLVRLFFQRDWTAGAPAGREMPTWRTGMTPDE